MHDPRASYLASTVATASPAQLVTMLYDRLLLDLDRAAAALGAEDTATARRELDHAQDVVGELMSGLDQDAWDGGPALMQVYGYLLAELLAARTNDDAARVAACRELVAPLADAWHQAAEQLAAPAPAPAAPTPAGNPFAGSQPAAGTGGLLGIG
ncbi:flagellar export chaperone FliS [Puerhibacterium sp. TATVAM-FAB25]|uniref:flagellar export chaperone FliS n=1 Tax=Puerhibacterium sp. TATVAM-FAB25 TaxID=3093699 RepID=UPI00397A57BC